MDSSAHFNFEHSPAESNIESFASTPVSFCPSLFDNTMNPIEVLTPQSFDDECFFGNITDNTPMEKKPVKKRKSWGQQLPEPKTNLPPRKRAKTEDEKEQRRVERVLRNRRAAQSSRERKRQEVEALEAEKQAIERKNLDLEMRLADMEARYHLLQQELERFGGSAIRSFSVSTPPQSDIRASSPITFSQKLFASSSETPSSMTTRTISTGVPETVDPASLSPEIRPVASSSNAKSSDLTQHPAAVLCDLQCQSETTRPWKNLKPTLSMKISRVLVATYLIMTSATFSSLLTPIAQIMNSLKRGSPLSPTHSILSLIIWMATTTVSLTNSYCVTSSMTNLRRMKFSVRTSLLRRLLACSPNLARPLMDATMAAMRSASRQFKLRSGLSAVNVGISECESPSFEALMTLFWVVYQNEKVNLRRNLPPKPDAASELDTAGVKVLLVREGSSYESQPQAKNTNGSRLDGALFHGCR
ncbi:bZIP transcription factor HacA [Blumeria hordei DH14]|uniref:BZIP transcription factor HacA n=1 Tax=Blumeria graminis f. sp. hordei (strain DH14) TaxID=546991 RepID=N1JG22_BLUG1|nr:bZIP transcription factor HacA [Blumeria hordei DH14]